MGLLVRFVRRFFKSFTIVGADGTPYLRRYYIIRGERFRVFLHEILRSDEDPYMHTHPWDFTTVLLSGGYIEELPTGKIKRKRFSVIRHKADDLHRIELDQPVWTLFMAGKAYREWGFQLPGRWIHHREFLDQKFGLKSTDAQNAIKEMGD